MKQLIPRPHFLNKLIKFREVDVIKVVTGVRRCGKSSLFELFIEQLLEEGVDAERIIHINLEDVGLEHLQDYRILHEFLLSKLQANKMNYVFVDEVGRCKEFEKAIDSIYIKQNTDVYLTGSNADLLSGEISTLLSGRYVEIKMLPFSFAEFFAARSGGGGDSNSSKQQAFSEYLNTGGFPVVATQPASDMEFSDRYLEGIFNTIILKDVVSRKGVGDVNLLTNIVKFLCANIGNSISTANICTFINSSGRKITQRTVDKYLKALVDSFLLYKVDRYSIKDKSLLKTLGKYYMVDTGLRNHLLATVGSDIGHQLENVVYLELLRRGYRVSIGKIGDKEVDFIATKQDVKEYYQVSMSAVDEAVLNRELSSLQKIGDNYPKFLLTLDPLPSDNSGIKQLNLIDWLLA